MGEVYADYALSWASAARPCVQQLLADARAGRAEVVLAEGQAWVMSAVPELAILEREVWDRTQARLEVSRQVVPAPAANDPGGDTLHPPPPAEQFDYHTLPRLPTGIIWHQSMKAHMLVFEGRLLRTEPWTEVLWIYDLCTDEGFREQLREEMWDAGASTEDGSCTTETQRRASIWLL